MPFCSLSLASHTTCIVLVSLQFCDHIKHAGVQHAALGRDTVYKLFDATTGV
jgi:hypothetical protein